MQDVDERQQAEFNNAISNLNRLNILFYQADNAAMTLNAHEWYHTLITIFRELSPYMNEDEIIKSQEIVDNVHPDIENNTRKQQRMGTFTISKDIYKTLHKFEIYLRKIQKDSGLLMRFTDDATKALR